MENYEKNTYPENPGETAETDAVSVPETEPAEAEIIEAEIIEADAAEDEPAGETQSPKDADSSDETAEESEPEKSEDDISSVAEKLAAIRNPFVRPDDPDKTEAADNSNDADDDERVRLRDKTPDECGLFKGFTLKKALVTGAAVALTLCILAAAMVAAIVAAGDKTKRASDFDMVTYEKAESAAREAAKDRDSLDTAEDTARFKVTFDFYDRDDIELYTSKMTLGELLEKSGIELEEGEEPAIELDTMLGDEATVAFDKYEYTTAVEEESVPYESDKRETDLIPRGTTNYLQYGVEGKVEKTYSVKKKNGEEISRELVSEETVEMPTNEIVEVGVGGSFVGADGNTYTYSYRRIVKATYYYIPDDPYTYLGNHPNSQTIAVDMNVIPLGTWLYVKNSRYDFGLRQAQDIGGAVKGDMIDIWLEGSEAGYASFVQEGLVYDMEVYYVD